MDINPFATNFSPLISSCIINEVKNISLAYVSQVNSIIEDEEERSKLFDALRNYLEYVRCYMCSLFYIPTFDPSNIILVGSMSVILLEVDLLLLSL